jgi:transposase
LRSQLGVAVALWSICRALKQLKLSYKKSRFGPASRIVRTSWRTARPGD